MDMALPMPISPASSMQISTQTTVQPLSGNDGTSDFSKVLQSAYQSTIDSGKEPSVEDMLPFPDMPTMAILLSMLQPSTIPQQTDTANSAISDIPPSQTATTSIIASSSVLASTNGLELTSSNISVLGLLEQPKHGGEKSSTDIVAQNSQTEAAIPLQPVRQQNTPPSVKPTANSNTNSSLPIAEAQRAATKDLPLQTKSEFPSLFKSRASQSIHPQQLTGVSEQAASPNTIPVASANHEEEHFRSISAVPSELQADTRQAKDGDTRQFSGFEQNNNSQEIALMPAVISDKGTDASLFQVTLFKQLVFQHPKTLSEESAQPQLNSTDKYDVTSQIVEQAKLIARPHNTEMVIKLRPEHLGELTFKVAVEQGALTATFHSNNPEVRSIIETSLPQLKQELNNQGIKLDNVGVFAGMDQFLSGDHRREQPYQQAAIPSSQKKPSEFAEAVAEIANEPTRTVLTGGVDYRI